MADEEPSDSVPAQDKQEEKKQGTLESVVDELSNFGKGALKIGAVAAMPFAYSFIDPSHLLNAGVFTHAITAGRATANLIQKKPVLDGVVKEAAIGATLSYPISKTFQGLNQLEQTIAANYGQAVASTAKVGVWAFGAQPALTTGRTFMHYGLGKNFREHAWPSVKATFKYLALPASINVAFLYQFGLFTQMAVSGTLSYFFGLIQAARTGEGSVKNLFKAINPLPYIGAGVSVTGKLAKNVFYGVPQAVYGLGSSISDYFKRKPREPTPTSPTPEPAPAT